MEILDPEPEQDHTGLALLEEPAEGRDKDRDSGLEDMESSASSAHSSFYDYKEENGRTYHAFRDGDYLLPNDIEEQDRMTIHAKAVDIIFDGNLFFAPVPQLREVLDVGTGTAEWAIDVADKHEGTAVYGTDLSPIQPEWAPQNTEFFIDDFNDAWTWSEDKFDLVHARNCNYSVRSYKHFFEEAYRCLSPGGFVELQEYDLDFKSHDGSSENAKSVQKCCKIMNEGFLKHGTSGRFDPKEIVQKMKAVGLINCNFKTMELPIGSWPEDKKLKKAGRLALTGILEGLTGLCVRTFTEVLHRSRQEMELEQPNIHGYIKYHVVYGQKPRAHGQTNGS